MWPGACVYDVNLNSLSDVKVIIFVVVSYLTSPFDSSRSIFHAEEILRDMPKESLRSGLKRQSARRFLLFLFRVFFFFNFFFVLGGFKT